MNINEHDIQMKLDALEPGIYVLTQDVKNPQGDKRAKYDWTSVSVWQKGSLFLIKTRSYPRDESGKANGISRLRDGGAGDAAFGYSPVTAALLPFLKKQSPDVDEVFALAGVYDHQGVAVLNKLVEAGKVSLADVQEAVDHLYDGVED